MYRTATYQRWTYLWEWRVRYLEKDSNILVEISLMNLKRKLKYGLRFEPVLIWAGKFSKVRISDFTLRSCLTMVKILPFWFEQGNYLSSWQIEVALTSFLEIVLPRKIYQGRQHEFQSGKTFEESKYLKFMYSVLRRTYEL